ncbi:MAG: hypothetical protein JW931_03675 [Methanomicrobiaceae archaeon]|nr:hypothetical protein [Methanomicrobiaceae archaeon]
MNHRQIKRRKVFFIIFLLVASSFLTMTAIAGAPPPQYRSKYLLPNSYEPEIYSFNVTDSFKGFNQPFRTSPYFPNMTKNFAFMNISYDTTDDRYISEVWYFNDWDEFDMQRDVLFDYQNRHGTISNVTLDLSEELAIFNYLNQHGTISNETIDLSEELAGTHDDYISRLENQEIDAIQYESPETSGYFIIFATDFFPGPNYYIAYYGTAGPGVLENHSGRLETIIMTAVPGFLEGRSYIPNPESPMPDTATPLPVMIPALSLGVAFLLRRMKGGVS